MATYKYQAINNAGKFLTGEISASESSYAVKSLQEQGLIVTDLSVVKEKRKTKSKKKVKTEDLAIFSRQMASMVSAGIPVTRCIATLSKQTENPGLAEALAEISSAIESGTNLTTAFSKYPHIFSKLYIAMINAGEVGGILEQSLDRLAVQLQKEKQLQDNIKSATSYPKMIGGFAVLMFFAMLLGLVPVFEGFIPEGTEMPGITKMTFALSHNIKDFWFVWIGAIALIAFGAIKFAKSKKGRRLWEEHKLTLPLFGTIIHKSVIARFARTFATLMQGGIPVARALESSAPTAGSELVAEAIEDAIIKIESGKNISEPLSESGLFPPMVISMIAIGEESGTLPELLDKVAEFYEDDVATLTKNLGSIIEPIMLILIGLVVGGMLLSLYLPIFTAATSAA